MTFNDTPFQVYYVCTWLCYEKQEWVFLCSIQILPCCSHMHHSCTCVFLLTTLPCFCFCGIVHFQGVIPEVDSNSWCPGVGESHLMAALCLMSVTRLRISTLEKSNAVPKWPWLCPQYRKCCPVQELCTAVPLVSAMLKTWWDAFVCLCWVYFKIVSLWEFLPPPYNGCVIWMPAKSQNQF